MKKFKKILWIVLALIAILAPFVSVSAYAICSAPQFSNNFVGRLNEKFDRLTETEEKKIVVVGGSSVAFGIDSAMIERYTGYQVVNFGLYAALGTKLMLDLSKAGIKEGDVVVLAPEMDAQTLSLYFSSETTLNALDDDFSMVRYVGSDNYLSLLGGMWKYAARKMEYVKDGTPNPSGAYNANNFNEYGDVTYERPLNTMRLGYDPNTVITLDESIVDSEFLDYLNEYIEWCEKRGAKVYFSWCPMNSAALAEGTTDESVKAFASYLKEKIHATFISEIRDSIMDPGYFFDTNFHLNDSGVIAHTVTLTQDLLMELEITKPITETIPAPTAVPEMDSRYEGEDANAVYFTFKKEKDLTYTVTGLTEEGKGQTVLTLPLGYNGRKVCAIASGAFAGSTAEQIILPEGCFISRLENNEDKTVGAFDGANQLLRVDLYIPVDTDISPCVFHPIAGFELHVPIDSNYREGYFWSERSLLDSTAFVNDLILNNP